MTDKVIVVTMVTEHEGCDPIDQGVQAVCANLEAALNWMKREYSGGEIRSTRNPDAYEIFTKEGVSLEAYFMVREMEIVR
jgi:hypothetical protein